MKSVVAFLAAWPFAAAADLVILEYEGIVTQLINSPETDFVVGDRVAGRLTIDTALAPPDVDSSPYTAYRGPETIALDFVPNFITGHQPPSVLSTDLLVLTDGRDGGLDRFEAHDDNAWQRGSGLDIFASAPSFIDGEDIEQAFELDRSDVEEGRGELFGYIRPFTDQFVRFVINHLSAKPGSCRAP